MGISNIWGGLSRKYQTQAARDSKDSMGRILAKITNIGEIDLKECTSSR